jgi:hypothetical protein
VRTSSGDASQNHRVGMMSDSSAAPLTCN